MEPAGAQLSWVQPCSQFERHRYVSNHTKDGVSFTRHRKRQSSFYDFMTSSAPIDHDACSEGLTTQED